MLSSVDQGLSFIRMSVSNFSHFWHLHQNHIRNGHHGLQLLSSPNCKSDGTETWWKASGQHGDLELLEWFILISKMATMAAILKIFKSYLLPNRKSDWPWTWWEATHIFSANNFRKLYIESAKIVNEMALNELVKLTTLWITGPRIFRIKRYGLDNVKQQSQNMKFPSGL